MTTKFTITRYETDVALGKVLRLCAFGADWHRETTRTLYERVTGPIADKQYFFIRDAYGDLGFVAWGNLSRESLARYVGAMWPINHISSMREKRYIFIALSPFMDWTDMEKVLLETASAEKIEWWMRDINAPALIQLKAT